MKLLKPKRKEAATSCQAVYLDLTDTTTALYRNVPCTSHRVRGKRQPVVQNNTLAYAMFARNLKAVLAANQHVPKLIITGVTSTRILMLTAMIVGKHWPGHVSYSGPTSTADFNRLHV